jgi:hypothetical protein
MGGKNVNTRGTMKVIKGWGQRRDGLGYRPGARRPSCRALAYQRVHGDPVLPVERAASQSGGGERAAADAFREDPPDGPLTSNDPAATRVWVAAF